MLYSAECSILFSQHLFRESLLTGHFSFTTLEWFGLMK